MIPRRVELTNFLSFGNRQILEFTDDEPLSVLCGANGVGKSAVFDAITFALYGCHRGGTHNADQLIRHGANTFLVVFEFEFNGTCYEIQRGRDRRKPIHGIRKHVGAHWSDIDLTAYPRDSIRAWSEETLGIPYATFTASVMLKQNEADRIITAPPRERLELLRRILGTERYERLHNRVNTATKERKAQFEALVRERDQTPAPTEEELREAATELVVAEDKVATTLQTRDAVLQLIQQARQWTRLDLDRVDILRRISEADARAADQAQIRQDHARFTELQRVLPLARELLGLRDQLAQLDTEITERSEHLERETAAHDEAAREMHAARTRETKLRQQVEQNRLVTRQQQDEIERSQRLVALADEVEQLQQQLRAFPDDLDACRDAAMNDVQRLTGERYSAGERRASAETLFQSAEIRRQEFDSVEVGAECSRCGQRVSEEHAQRERATLDAEIAQHRNTRDATAHAETAAIAAIIPAQATHDQHTKSVLHRDRVRERLEVQQRNFANHGVDRDAATLRATVADLVRQTTDLQAATATATHELIEAEKAVARHEANHQQHAKRLTSLTTEINSATAARSRFGGRRDAQFDQLPTSWSERISMLTTDELAHEQAELDRLQSTDIAGRLQQLTEDAARRDEWERRLSQINEDIERIPPDARQSTDEVERDRGSAVENYAFAQSELARSRARHTQLLNNAERRSELDKKHRELEHDLRRHNRLEGLLSASGLQRVLVRTAEREIVRYANETVASLSRGDLTIELEPEEAGSDPAFALQVRRADSPTPIDVKFLSGSQKFRVAVAVALAIGRFATGQTRPLESVIIDEGFGSLDRDGLQAMSDELRNLQQSQSLRRLVLVSHQEEFVSRFPVGYRLEQGANGTTATRFRRDGGESV